MKQIRILLADDHVVMRRGIRALLDQGTEVAALQDLHRGQVAASGGSAAGD